MSSHPRQRFRGLNGWTIGTARWRRKESGRRRRWRRPRRLFTAEDKGELVGVRAVGSGEVAAVVVGNGERGPWAWGEASLAVACGRRLPTAARTLPHLLAWPEEGAVQDVWARLPLHLSFNSLVSEPAVIYTAIAEYWLSLSPSICWSHDCLSCVAIEIHPHGNYNIRGMRSTLDARASRISLAKFPFDRHAPLAPRLGSSLTRTTTSPRCAIPSPLLCSTDP